MPKNPMNALNSRINILKSELGKAQDELKSLKSVHSKIVREAVQLENDLEFTKVAVSDFCESCSVKFTDSCHECNLYQIAVRFNLFEI